jgi:hypothetical protein
MAVAERLLDSVFREVSKASLDADTAVCFVLDEKLQLTYCNPAWDQFAVQNDAPHLVAEKVLGMHVLQSTSGPLVGYYQSLFAQALADRQPTHLDFQCSSAELERLMEMHVNPLRRTRALLIACSIRLEKPHDPSREPVQDGYRDEHGVMTMCSNCRRTRRAGVKPETWDWIAEFVEHQQKRVSHGLCDLCLEYYYPGI